MSDPIITNIDNGVALFLGGFHEDQLLTLAGADVIAAGTILARDSASQKYVLFVKGGSTNGNGIPKAVLLDPVTSTGAGDSAIRPLIDGKLRTDKLVIDADGDASNIDAVVRDQLRDYSLVCVDVGELNILDNQ